MRWPGWYVVPDTAWKRYTEVPLLINAIKEFKLRPFIIIFVYSVANIFATKTRKRRDKSPHTDLACFFVAIFPIFPDGEVLNS
jgi:hypothetical protein